jgi:alcohol dehydrogenase YqhD (iron-dependent ADH family)
VCILAAFVMVGIAALNHGENLALPLAFFSVVAAAIAVSGLLGYGVVDAWRVHRSRG